MVLLGGGRIFRRWGLAGGSWLLGHVLEEILGCQSACAHSLSPYLFFSNSISFVSWTPWGKQASSTMCSCRDVLCATSPTQQGQQTWTETSKAISPKKSLLLLSWFPRVFCYSGGKLTHFARSCIWGANVEVKKEWEREVGKSGKDEKAHFSCTPVYNPQIVTSTHGAVTTQSEQNGLPPQF